MRLIVEFINLDLYIRLIFMKHVYRSTGEFTGIDSFIPVMTWNQGKSAVIILLKLERTLPGTDKATFRKIEMSFNKNLEVHDANYKIHFTPLSNFVTARSHRRK